MVQLNISNLKSALCSTQYMPCSMAHARNCRCIAILSVVHTHTTHTQHTHTHTHNTHTHNTHMRTTITCTCPGGSSDGSGAIGHHMQGQPCSVQPPLGSYRSRGSLLGAGITAPPSLTHSAPSAVTEVQQHTHSQGSPPESTCPAAWHMQDIADV